MAGTLSTCWGAIRDEVAKQTVQLVKDIKCYTKEFSLYPFAVRAQRRVFKRCTNIIRFVFHKWNSGNHREEELAGEESGVRETS